MYIGANAIFSGDTHSLYNDIYHINSLRCNNIDVNYRYIYKLRICCLLGKEQHCSMSYVSVQQTSEGMKGTHKS